MSGARGELASWLGSNVIFLALPVSSGFFGGFIFPIAGALCLDNEEDRGRIAGINYGRDLLGSCVGALLTGAFLLPILGIPKTCLVIAALNFQVLLVLIAGVIFL
jgi:MFS family permease